MTSTIAEATSALRSAKDEGANDKAVTRMRRSRTTADEETDGNTRYFLAGANGAGRQPALDRELASEGEALVEALRLGVSFYAVQEFRAVADFSGRKPQLNKEAVIAK